MPLFFAQVTSFPARAFDIHSVLPLPAGPYWRPLGHRDGSREAPNRQDDPDRVKMYAKLLRTTGVARRSALLQFSGGSFPGPWGSVRPHDARQP